VNRRRLFLLIPILVLLALLAWRFWPRGGDAAFPYEGVNDPPAKAPPAPSPPPRR
jgi:hypothetical protein